MNEVAKIHLGRQAFDISADAHKDLKAYLDAIKKQVGEEDVMQEVENRMAELLNERGVTGDKVILQTDVDYLKEQLGDPKDFGEEPLETVQKTDGKRLYRDANNAMLAGVAAGLAQYFGIDVVLFRILFVIGIFTGGWGILIYILLWLIVPEAKTPSDKLRMAGKPVTVEGLKEVVERADIKSAAKRANNTLAGPINTIFDIFLKTIGIFIILSGLTALFALVAFEIYVLVHGNNLLQDNIFPIGFKEHLLLDIAITIGALISIFTILIGMALFIRKWPVGAWITGVLIGLIFIGMAAGAALSADSYPQVRDRYNANLHTSIRSLGTFNQVKLVGEGVGVNFETADKYSASISYFDHPDISKIKTTVSANTLTIDSSQFDWHRHCSALCLPDTYEVVITIKTPVELQVTKRTLPTTLPEPIIYTSNPI